MSSAHVCDVAANCRDRKVKKLPPNGHPPTLHRPPGLCSSMHTERKLEDGLHDAEVTGL